MKRIKTVMFVLALVDSILLFSAFSHAQVSLEYRNDLPPIGNNTVYGIAPGVMAFSGDVDGVSNSLDMELFTRVPLADADDAALYCAVGYSRIEGKVFDANVPSRVIAARNPFAYALFMPSYKINSYKRISVWMKAGVGMGYLKAKNSDTQGTKLFLPIGVDFNYHFSQQWMFTTNLSYMICGSDLDGLKHSSNPDYRESDNLISLVMGIGFIP